MEFTSTTYRICNAHDYMNSIRLKNTGSQTLKSKQIIYSNSLSLAFQSILFSKSLFLAFSFSALLTLGFLSRGGDGIEGGQFGFGLD